MTPIRVFAFFILAFSLQDIHSNGYSVVTGVPLPLFEVENEVGEPDYLNLPLEDEISTSYEATLAQEMEENTNEVWRDSPTSLARSDEGLHKTLNAVHGRENKKAKKQMRSLENEILKELEGENTERMQTGDTTTKSQRKKRNLEEDLSTIPNYDDLTESDKTVYRTFDELSDIDENSFDSPPQPEKDTSPESAEVENVERVQSEETKTESKPVAEDSNDFSTTSIDKELTELDESIDRLLNELSATEIAENAIDSALQSEEDISPDLEVENIERVQSGGTKTESEPECQLMDEDSNDLRTNSIDEDKTTTPITSTELSCQDDKKPVKQEKRYALAVFFKTNWFRAYQYCKYHGMQLATINSHEEELELESALGKIGYDLRDVWTSGTDKGEEGNFNWMSTGTPFTYTNWYHGEPNGRNRENCVTIFRATEGYFWNDALCDNEYYFACEYYTADKTDAPTFV